MTTESFYDWMCRHARAMGWELDERAQKTLHVWAAIAATNGLDDAQTAQLARGLGRVRRVRWQRRQPGVRSASL
ncbi:hypothetical protein [Streptomyces lanatus]|uniref:Uncharacterized protein n=1 Tax=Streptomyces lanatus TaxID=66900 RepID=A0ABV1Y0J3_9ACTN|nr:hypothetical protein [Streptomyces lanatus]GHH22356.1 hypothetical protein GCM10018780_70750 [Streptomyces lanatus]